MKTKTTKAKNTMDESLLAEFNALLAAIPDVPCGDCVYCCQASGLNPDGLTEYEKSLLPEEPNGKAPCQFLKNNKCSVRDVRPIGCRLYGVSVPCVKGKVSGKPMSVAEMSRMAIRLQVLARKLWRTKG